MGLTANHPQAAGVLGGLQQGHLPKAQATFRAGARADPVHRDDRVWSLALVLAAATEGAVPSLPQGPRHACAVCAGCSGDGEVPGTEEGGKTQTIPGQTLPGKLTTPRADLEGCRGPRHGHRRAKETLGSTRLQGRLPLPGEGRDSPHFSSGMQSPEWRRCKMVPSEQTQPSPSTWHCSGSSGPSIPSWHVLGGSQADTHAWYVESLEHRKAAGARQWAPGPAQTPGGRAGGSSVPQQRVLVQQGLVHCRLPLAQEPAKHSPQP